METDIRTVLNQICDYDDLHTRVLEKMMDINAVLTIKADYGSDSVHFILNCLADLLKHELIVGSAFSSVIELNLPDNANKPMLDEMYADVKSKMTEHDYDKIAIDHYDDISKRLYENLREDAIFKCVMLNFKVEMIADAAIHFNSGADRELLEKLQAEADHSKVLASIASMSHEFALKFSSTWNQNVNFDSEVNDWRELFVQTN